MVTQDQREGTSPFLQCGRFLTPTWIPRFSILQAFLLPRHQTPRFARSGITNIMSGHMTRKWPHRGIRTEQYKLIQYVLDPSEGELHDLKTDPGEQNNLYSEAEHAVLQVHLSAGLDALRSNIPERKESSTI